MATITPAKRLKPTRPVGRARPHSDDDGGTGSAMQSVQRVCSILLSFKVEEPILGVSEIARRLDLPKSAVHRLLDSLVQLGLVARDRASSRYRLGPRAVELGFAALGTPDIRGLAMPVLQDLSRRSVETATMSLLAGHERFYAAQVPSVQDVKMTVELGRRCPSTPARRDRRCSRSSQQRNCLRTWQRCLSKSSTEKTITRRDQLMQKLERVRRNGFAVSLGERDPWAAAVASPVFLGDVLVASISVCGPVDRFGEEQIREYGEMVRLGARHLSEQIG